MNQQMSKIMIQISTAKINDPDNYHEYMCLITTDVSLKMRRDIREAFF